VSSAIPFNPGSTSWDWAAAGKSGTSDITATVDYGSERWGTVLAAKTSGILVGTTCQLRVVHQDGSRTKVTEWTTAPDEGQVW
jgi:hypothetical protein